MLVNRIYINNNLRNFNYLVACEDTRQALVIDPLDADLCLEVAKLNGYNIKQIFNTHEHWDHIHGNAKLKQLTGAKVLANGKLTAVIPEIDHGVSAGEVIKVGNSVNLQCLATPGHTANHVCLLSIDSQQSALFSGDTLFNAGCGNCYSGNITDHYNTFVNQLVNLPDNTLIYPGHDYLVNNLNFTLSLEDDNLLAKNILEQASQLTSQDQLVLTIKQERTINLFFKLNDLTLIDTLSKKDENFPKNPSKFAVFSYLRKLRDSW